MMFILFPLSVHFFHESYYLSIDFSLIPVKSEIVNTFSTKSYYLSMDFLFVYSEIARLKARLKNI